MFLIYTFQRCRTGSKNGGEVASFFRGCIMSIISMFSYSYTACLILKYKDYAPCSHTATRRVSCLDLSIRSMHYVLTLLHDAVLTFV